MTWFSETAYISEMIFIYLYHSILHCPPQRGILGAKGVGMEAAAVVSHNLSIVRGGKRILQHVSFRIDPGSVTGLIGPSGSGKTTLMRAIVGLQKVTDGAIDVLGLPAGSAPLRPRIGYMAQSLSVYEDLSVWQNVIYFARILGYPHEEAVRVIEVVDLAAQQRQMV